MKIIVGDTIRTITPEDLAEEWSNCTCEQQARFFNALAEQDWVRSGCLPFQLQSITDDSTLTTAGRRVMQQIGEYCGLYKQGD